MHTRTHAHAHTCTRRAAELDLVVRACDHFYRYFAEQQRQRGRLPTAISTTPTAAIAASSTSAAATATSLHQLVKQDISIRQGSLSHSTY
jgi:hypothetical protein